MAGAPLVLLGLGARLSLAFQVPDSLPPAALDEECMYAVAGDHCHRAVTYALQRGLAEHPELYPKFQRSGSGSEVPGSVSAKSDFRNMQEYLHRLSKAGCGRPCPPGYVPPVRTETRPEAQPEVQTAARTEVQTEAREVEATTPEPKMENRSMTEMSLDSLSKYLEDPRWRGEYEKGEAYEATMATAAALERKEHEATVAAAANLEREEHEKGHPVGDEVANATDEAANATTLESVEASAPLPLVVGEERAGEAADVAAPLPLVVGDGRWAALAADAMAPESRE